MTTIAIVILAVASILQFIAILYMVKTINHQREVIKTLSPWRSKVERIKPICERFDHL